MARVAIRTSDVSVRCTGHLSAISISLLALLRVKIAFDRDLALDLIEHAVLGFAVLAVFA